MGATAGKRLKLEPEAIAPSTPTKHTFLSNNSKHKEDNRKLEDINEKNDDSGFQLREVEGDLLESPDSLVHYISAGMWFLLLFVFWYSLLLPFCAVLVCACLCTSIWTCARASKCMFMRLCMVVRALAFMY